jgi:hypothetical protein
MTQITIEYMIMIPLLIMQIILFPFVAGLIMNGWVDSRRTLVLQETASNLGSSIQQLYSALNHGTISTGNVTNTLELPMFIEDYAYSGTGTLRATSGPTVDSTKILYITLSLRGQTLPLQLLLRWGRTSIGIATQLCTVTQPMQGYWVKN